MLRKLACDLRNGVYVLKPMLIVAGVILSTFFLMIVLSGCAQNADRMELFVLDPDTTIAKETLEGVQIVKVRIPTKLLRGATSKLTGHNPLEKYCCFVVGPEQTFVQRLCPVHCGEGKVLDILKAETLAMTQYARENDEPVSSFCWIYNEELNIGANIPDIQGERLVFAKVVAAMRIPKDLNKRISRSTLRMDK